MSNNPTSEMNVQSEINRAVEAALLQERSKSSNAVKAEVEAAVETALIEERSKSSKAVKAEVEAAVEAALIEERRKSDEEIVRLESQIRRLQLDLNKKGTDGLDVKRESERIVMNGMLTNYDYSMYKLDIIESVNPQILFYFFKQLHYWLYIYQ